MASGSIPTNGLTYKTSRRSYIENYIIVCLAAVILFMAWPMLGLDFSLTPSTQMQFFSTMFVFAFIIVAAVLFEEPSIEGFVRRYIVTNHEIVKIEGIFSKKKISIPYQSVANVKISKSFLGRLMDYGTLHITCVGKEGNDIIMKGIASPDVVYSIIQNKISLMRKSIKHKKKTEKIGDLSEDEREEAKDLEMHFEEDK